jgi:organic radical activating enzyme
MLEIIQSKKCEVTDIFSSIQGEGVFIGAKQIFVRFKACNLSCSYCDERGKLAARWLTPLELMSEVRFLELSQGPHHSVSLTGGEPLLCADFLKAFLKLLRRDKMTVYLETNGTLPEKLGAVIDLVDIIAMDIKLPSSTGQRAYWKESLAFLKIAARKKAFVKAVVTAGTRTSDIKRAASLVRRIDRLMPFIIQPASPASYGGKNIDSKVLLKFLEAGSRTRLDNVRVIPQMHKTLGVK